MKNIPYIIILFLFGVVVYLLECKRQPVQDPIIEYKTDSIVTVITKIDTIYIPKWKTKTETKIDSFIDTVYIIKDYNTKYFYSDVILNDFRGLIKVNDTIYQNRIKSREISVNIKNSIEYRTAYIEKPNKPYFVYGFGAYGWVDKFGFEFNAGFATRKQNIYFIGYDPINKAASIRVLFKY